MCDRSKQNKTQFYTNADDIFYYLITIIYIFIDIIK